MDKFNEYLEYSGLEKKPHQYEGVKWCLKREKSGGGIIADEMGLGKTIIMLGTMYSNKKKKTLIVLPVSLIEQWNQQIKKTMGIEAVIYHGKQKKEAKKKVNDKKYPIIITSYTTLINEPLLQDYKWNRIVYDEAHYLRNDKTIRYEICSEIDANITWLITGTLIQNKINDFYNLCDIANIPHERNMSKTIQKYVLRRTKENVNIHLPEVILNTENVYWKNSTEEVLSKQVHRNAQMSDKKLVAYTRAKQMCVLPKLINNFNFMDEPLKINRDSALKYSSKLDKVVSCILSRRDNGNGKLVFCHFKGEIDFIKERLENEKVSVAVLDGRTNEKERKEILDMSKGCPYHVIILQIQTGCEGLNLQEYFNEIYFITPHWNPSVEDQAIARCHRIGQTKPVIVYRFIMKGFKEEEEKELSSMDDYIYNVQKQKRELYI